MHDRRAGIAQPEGFSLLEALIAIAVVTIVGLGVSGLVLSSVDVTRNGDFVGAASFLAVTKLSELQQIDIDALVAGSFEDAPSLQGRDFDRTWTISADTPVDGVTRIEVVVTAGWEAQGARRSARVTGYRTDSSYAQAIHP